jgi:putative transposase
MKDNQFNPQNQSESSDFAWFTQASTTEQLKMLLDFPMIIKQILENLMQKEVEDKAGTRYCRSASLDFYRWSSNPSTISIGTEKIPIDALRIQHKETKKVDTVAVFKDFKALQDPSEDIYKQILLGITTRDYEQVFKSINESIGLSKSTISRHFKAACEEALKQFESRSLADDRYIALYLDGKSFEKEQIIIALGVTDMGQKKVLGFIQSAHEARIPVEALLHDLMGRGFSFDDALLAIIDGSKGFNAALKSVFGDKVCIQRCRIHKIRNVLSYLAKQEHSWLRRQMQKVYATDTYEEAKSLAMALHQELFSKNRAAAQSLLEGLEETLTLQKLGMNALFSKGFGSTNCIESLNAQLQKYTGRVKRWVDSDQRYRWVAASLLQTEPRLRRVDNFTHLDKLHNALSHYCKSLQNNTTHE